MANGASMESDGLDEEACAFLEAERREHSDRKWKLALFWMTVAVLTALAVLSKWPNAFGGIFAPPGA